MAQLPNFFLGRFTSAVTMTPQTVGSGGALTAGTPFSILALFKTIKRTSTNETENVSGTYTRNKNMVIIETGTDYEITGLILNNDQNGGGVNQVNDTILAYDYIQIVQNRAGRVVSYYGVVKSYEENIAGKGAVEFTLVLEFADIGSATANPAWS